MKTTIEELTRLKTIMDQLDGVAELVGQAYYDVGYSSVYDIEEDGFNISISLPRDGEEREFVSWEELLSDEWIQGLHNKIEENQQAKLSKKAKQQSDTEEKERQLYARLRQKYEPSIDC